MAHKIIYDTDPGVDDAMALLLLARHPEVELIGVTSIFGNADIDTTTRNALYLKQRLGVAAPVARGAGVSLTGHAGHPPTFIHGHNGLGDIDLPAVTAEADPRPAHRLIIDLVRQYPHEVTIVAVGRVTNLAMAMREDPELPALCKRVVAMGGAFGRNGHTGNVTPVAEANIIGDPLAADLVLGADWPVTMAGLDVTHQVFMSDAYVNDLATLGEDGRFARDISRGYQAFYRSRLGIDGFYVHDASAVAFALHPEFFRTETGPIRVVTEGIAAGQTIIRPDGSSYPPGAWDNRPSQTICVDVDDAALLEFYRETIRPG